MRPLAITLLLVFISHNVFAKSISHIHVDAPTSSLFGELFSNTSAAGRALIDDINDGEFIYVGNAEGSDIQPKIQCSAIAITDIDPKDVSHALTEELFEQLEMAERFDPLTLQDVRKHFDSSQFEFSDLSQSTSPLGASTVGFFHKQAPLFLCFMQTSPTKNEAFSNSNAQLLFTQILEKIPDYREGLSKVTLAFSPYSNIALIELQQTIHNSNMSKEQLFIEPVQKWGPLFSNANVTQKDNVLTFLSSRAKCQFLADAFNGGFNVKASCANDQGLGSITMDSNTTPKLVNKANINFFFIDWLLTQPSVKKRFAQVKSDTIELLLKNQGVRRQSRLIL